MGSWKMIAIPAACDCLASSKIASSPSQHDPAGIRLMHAREDLHERRLAGAVLAHQPVHLAAEQLDVAVLERMHGAEALSGVLERDQGRGVRCRHGSV